MTVPRPHNPYGQATAQKGPQSGQGMCMALLAIATLTSVTLINFDNKLKGLEGRDNYPKEKPWYFRPGKDTHCDYNIVSNIDM